MDNNLSVEDLAYFAGITDGEGCITVSKNPKNGRNYYRLAFSIVNTNEELIDWIEAKFGGIAQTSYRRMKPNRTKIWEWRASGQQAQNILMIILPYLKVKKPQAELAILMDIAPYGGACRWTYTEEEEKSRETIRQGIHAYNSLGGNKGSYLWEKSLPKKEVYAPS